jgi:tetratricopeptide (TPR) repeat protein
VRVAEHWFRSGEWNAEARADFEVRLARARPSNRAQYIRIKALALMDAGNDPDAESLLERVVRDYPDEWTEVAPSYESLGILRRRARDLPGAEKAFRAAIMVSPTLSCTTGEVHIELGEVLLESNPDRAGEVEQLLREGQPHAKLNTSVFRWNVLRARLASVQGDATAARAAAEAALALLDAPPQFSRHPTVGLARPPQNLVAELEGIARS